MKLPQVSRETIREVTEYIADGIARKESETNPAVPFGIEEVILDQPWLGEIMIESAEHVTNPPSFIMGFVVAYLLLKTEVEKGEG